MSTPVMADAVGEWRTVWSSSGKTVLLKSHFDDTKCSYQVNVFDGFRFWQETMLRDDFCKKCRDSNPKVEADYIYLFNQIKCKCEEIAGDKDRKVDLSQDGRTCQIQLRFKLGGGVPFSWTFNLSEDSSPAIMSEELVMPLLSMVGELIQQRKELFNSIAKKDTEIQDYRDQGALTSRKSLETCPFEPSIYLEERRNLKDSLQFTQDPLLVFGEMSCQQLYSHVLLRKRRIAASKDLATSIANQATVECEELATQAIVPAAFEMSGVPDNDGGDEMTRRQKIVGRLAEKAEKENVSKSKKKRKKVNL